MTAAGDDTAWGTTTRALAELVQAPTAVFPAGTRLGERFRIIERIGAGGMGVVYRARDEQLSRDVAIKVHAKHAGAQRLQREATAMAQLAHPNVVMVHEVGTHDDAMFIAMELVAGETARSWRERERRTWRQVVKLYVAAGEGLLAIHDAGLVHRDFKPENVLVGDDGRVRVADLGLARAIGDGERVEALAATDATGHAGTPAYMAPEQRTGGAIDARSDQYSFGRALDEALRGLRPPARVRTALARAMEQDPAARWPTMRPLLAELGRDPRPRIAIAAAVVVALAGGVGAWRLAHRDDLCTIPASEVDGLWATSRAEVERAFAATGSPFAAATFARVDAILARRAASWQAARRDACEATRVRGDQSEELLDRRRSCLDARRAETADLASVLAHADPAVVEHALDAVEALPALARCSDLQALASRVPSPPSAIAPQVARIDQIVGEALAFHRAGQDATGLTRLTPAVAEASQLGYEPLVTRVEAALGELEASEGKAATAVDHLSHAYFTARRIGDDEASARTASDLVQVVGADLDRVDAVATWIELATAEIGRSAKHTRDEALLWIRIARVDDRAGRFDAAAGHLHDARALLAALSEGESTIAVEELVDEGTNLGHRGQNQNALDVFVRQRALVEKVYGPDHPAMILSLIKIGLRRSELGQDEAGIASLREAVALADRVVAPRHPRAIAAHANLGLALYNHMDFDGAIAEYERELPIVQSIFGEEHPRYALMLDNLGIAYLDSDRAAVALDLFQRVLAIDEKALSADHPDLALTLDHVGGALAKLHRCSEAIPLLQRAVAIYDKSAPDSGDRVYPLTDLGSCLTAIGKPADAIAPLEAALARFARESTRPQPPATARVALANALWLAGGDRRRARALAEQARDAYAALGERAGRQRREVEHWLHDHPLP